MSQLGQGEPHKLWFVQSTTEQSWLINVQCHKDNQNLPLHYNFWFDVSQWASIHDPVVIISFFPLLPEILAPQTFPTQRSKFWRLLRTVSCFVNIFVAESSRTLLLRRLQPGRGRGIARGLGRFASFLREEAYGEDLGGCLCWTSSRLGWNLWTRQQFVTTWDYLVCRALTGGHLRRRRKLQSILV